MAIIKFPKPSLRNPTVPVPDDMFGKRELLDHVLELQSTLRTEPYGMALASNQRFAEGLRLFVVRPGLTVPGVPTMGCQNHVQPLPEVVANPTWEVYVPHELDLKGTTQEELDEFAKFGESCLSIPELVAPIKREFWVDLYYQDQWGQPHCCVLLKGLGARLIQHECDHLDGKLIYDLVDKKTQLRVKQQAINNRRKGK